MHSNFGEEGEKFQKFEWFKNQESVLGKIKAFFIFLRALILSFAAGFGNFNLDLEYDLIDGSIILRFPSIQSFVFPNQSPFTLIIHNLK